MMSCSTQILGFHVGNGVLLQQQRLKNKLNILKKKQRIIRSWKFCAMSKTQQSLIRREDDQNMLSFSMRFFSDLPLNESRGNASFDQYLEDKPRLLKATFPGKSQQLNQEEWRLETPHIQLLFLKIWPVVDMKIISKTNGEDYPPDVPHHITKVLQLQMTNWEINGIHKDYRPSSANVCSKGAIYSEKRGTRSRLKFQLLVNLSFVVPHTLCFIPKDIFRNMVETVLKVMIEDLKHKGIDKLVEDYSKFKKEKK